MLDVRGLRGFDGINLGVYGPDGSGDQLIGAVRPGFTGRTSVDEMMDTYLPGFWNTRELSWSAAAENIRHVDATLRTPGLFWDEGWGSVHRATLWALCLMHRYADLVLDPTGVSGFSGDVLRRDLEAGSLRIRLKATPFLGWWADTAWMLLHVDAEQRFQLERISQRNINRVGASTSGGVIHVYPSTLIYGPVADYFFWHATKLHAWHAESGEPWAAVAGELCARAGLSEVAALAAVLIHEYTHDYRNRTYECAGGGHKAGCVTFLHQFTFYTRVLATHVLPLNRDLGMRNFVGPTPSLARYDVFGAAPEEHEAPSAFDGGGRCEPGGGTDLIVTARQRFWQSHSPVQVDWTVPGECGAFDVERSGGALVTTPMLRPS